MWDYSSFPILIKLSLIPNSVLNANAVQTRTVLTHARCLQLTKRTKLVTPIAQLTVITPAYHDAHLAFTPFVDLVRFESTNIISMADYRRKIKIIKQKTFFRCKQAFMM